MDYQGHIKLYNLQLETLTQEVNRKAQISSSIRMVEHCLMAMNINQRL